MVEPSSDSPSVTASAPAKAILFGEHATLYGQPALAVALDLRLKVQVRPASEFRVNNYRMTSHNTYRHLQIAHAVDLYWDDQRPVHFTTSSGIPSASGLGSSSAFTVATVGALAGLEQRGPTDPENDSEVEGMATGDDTGGTDEEEDSEGAIATPETIARRSFKVEWESHGKSSPLDTTCASVGGGVLMTPGSKREEISGTEELWEVERDGSAWTLHATPLPPMQLVVGYTGTKSKTGAQVAKVARFAGHSGFAKDILSDIGKITRQGVAALGEGDIQRTGELMNANHDLLTILGINTPQVQKLYQAAARHALGAKMTGAGGGGSIIALLAPDDSAGVSATVKALRRAGGQAMVVGLSQQGLEMGT